VPEHYDIVVRGPLIVDGTGRPPFVGDIAIKGQRIAALGEIKADTARQIDAAGLVACPGFIDPHSHADMTLLAYPLAENLVTQGITTFVGGNCGFSMAPLYSLLSTMFLSLLFPRAWWQTWEPQSSGLPLLLQLDRYADVLEQALGFTFDWSTMGQFLSRIEESGTSVNYVPLVGHHAVRLAAMGDDFRRQAEPREIQTMAEYVAAAMADGAFGLSSGVDYAPGEYAALEEIVELAKVAHAHGGLYVPHTRHTDSQSPCSDPAVSDYGVFHGPAEDVWVGRYRGYLEAIEIARRTGVALHIAHLSNAYKIPQPHPDYLDAAAARATLSIVDEAREAGLDVTFDVIPCSSSVAALSPLIDQFADWSTRLGTAGQPVDTATDDLRRALRQAYSSAGLKLGMIHSKEDPYWPDCFEIIVCRQADFEGRTVADIARERSTEALDTLLDILAQDPDTKWAQTLDRRLHPTAVPVLLKHPAASVCSDTIALPCGWRKAGLRTPPPIAYGLYPHYLSTYTRLEDGLNLEQAVQKATYLPAQRLGLKDRGLLAEGAYADLVVLDLDKLAMKGDFEEPEKGVQGVVCVLVNGEMVCVDGAHTGARPGQVLRHE